MRAWAAAPGRAKVAADHLARAEAELADLATTRRTLTTLTNDPDSATAEPARPARAAPPDGPTATTSRAGTGEPADAVAAMTSGEAIATTSPTYPQILAAFTGTDTMRAKDICLALGLDTLPKNTESVRAKLKRLVTQGAPDRQVTVPAGTGTDRPPAAAGRTFR